MQLEQQRSSNRLCNFSRLKFKGSIENIFWSSSIKVEGERFQLLEKEWEYHAEDLQIGINISNIALRCAM